jgi:hypothetical protein
MSGILARRRPARRPVPWRRVLVALGILALLPFAIPAAANTYSTVSLVQVTSTSPFLACDVSGQSGTNYPNTELEPFVGVNPNDSDNIIAVYQQDRWSDGAARGIASSATHNGGTNWTQATPHFSECAGGNAANGGDYERASDPWVTFSPNGDAYFISLSVSFITDPKTGILVAKSTDGGDTWSEPITLTRDPIDVAPFLFNDKESITADPLDSNFVYAVWDRARHPSDQAGFNAQHSFAFRGDIIFSRTTNGGTSWEPAHAIFKPKGLDSTVGNIIAVLPDGTLVDIFDNAQGSGNNFPGYDIEVIRSTDQGETWSGRTVVAPERAVRVFDPDTGASVRAGAGLPDIAADLNPSSDGYGNLYAVWGDSFGTGKGNSTKKKYDRVVFTMSTDGGLTWSPLSVISQSPSGVQAFTPMVAVAEDGTVGVNYYDFRNNTPDPGLPTDSWFVHCHPSTDCTDPANWSENHMAGPFDMEKAPISRGYFTGDYEGLTTAENDFLALITQTGATSNSDDEYLAKISPS